MNKDVMSIVQENEWLIYTIINKYQKYYDIDDLYQVAVLGIMNAYNNFDSKYGVKFSTYAYRYVLGEVKKFIDEDRSIKLGRTYLELSKKISEAKVVLSQKLMKEPSYYEISLFLELDEEIISNVMEMSLKIESLDYALKEDSKLVDMYDYLPSKEKVDDIDRIILHDEVNSLSEEERLLIKERYYMDRTQQEVATIMGVNQVYVSRKEKHVLAKLKNKIAS